VLHFGVRRLEQHKVFDVLDRHQVIAAELKRAALPPDPALTARLAQEKSRIARELLAASNPVAENCTAILAELASRYSLALASSGSRASVQAFLDTNGCAHLFRSVLTVNGKAEDGSLRRPAAR